MSESESEGEGEIFNKSSEIDSQYVCKMPKRQCTNPVLTSYSTFYQTFALGGFIAVQKIKCKVPISQHVV